jgi:[Skp1-protein]-hydroxyproline N-acetylglucosaminyltransferase
MYVLALVLVFAVFLLILLDFVEPYIDSPQQDAQTIFVSVPSYRDETCMETVRALFQKADNPKRVFVGCCEQNTKESKELCKPTSFKYHDNMRVTSIPHMEARGPTYARALCAALYRDEDYVLSIDAHSKFAQGWDTTLIAMLHRCPNPTRAILSHYPPGLDELGKSSSKTHVPKLCSCKFGEHGLPILDAVSLEPTISPAPVPFLAGGMWFARGRVFRDVPMDPTLEYLFQGEEFLLSARVWTSGYDIFTPTENVVFHDYERKHAARYWDDQPTWYAKQQETVKRVRRVLALDDGEDDKYKYGLGTKRTIQEYYAFAKIDPKKGVSKSRSKFC